MAEKAEVVRTVEVPFSCNLIVNVLADGNYEVYPEHGENIRCTSDDVDFAVGEVLKESAWYLEFAREAVDRSSNEAREKAMAESKKRREEYDAVVD